MAGFQHEALLYEGPGGFLDGVVPFLREGIAAGEPILVAVDASKIALLREHLGDEADAMEFAEMTELGRNPGRIIPAWRAFLDRQGLGRPVRGVGEPVWSDREPDELVESQLHEALLNLAFEDVRDFRLLCPYDTADLRGEVVHEARCSHPVVAGSPSHDYRGTADPLAPFDAPLPRPPARAETLGFERATLPEVRRLVDEVCERAGLSGRRRTDLVLAVDELATNSVRHGGGHGIVRLWGDEDALRCEVRDRGRIEDPLVGRRANGAEQIGGWGVWIAHQVADLVQVRSGPDGTVVRLKMRRA